MGNGSCSARPSGRLRRLRPVPRWRERQGARESQRVYCYQRQGLLGPTMAATAVNRADLIQRWPARTAHRGTAAAWTVTL